MHRQMIRDGFLVTLAESYERDPGEFVTLAQQAVDSSIAREVLAELRNDGFVEEQVRGVVRLTARGYKLYRHEPLAEA